MAWYWQRHRVSHLFCLNDSILDDSIDYCSTVQPYYKKTISASLTLYTTDSTRLSMVCSSTHYHIQKTMWGFFPGAALQDVISEAVNKSRRLVLILSRQGDSDASPLHPSPPRLAYEHSVGLYDALTQRGLRVILVEIGDHPFTSVSFFIWKWFQHLSIN